MGEYETILRLCQIARDQADIIERQAEIIAQSEIADSVAAGLAEKRAATAASLADIEKEYN